MVRALEHDGRFELRRAGCVGESELIEGVASPMQPNRYDYATAAEYERAVTAAFSCTRCGEAGTDAYAGNEDGSGTASGAGSLDGSGEGRGSAYV